MSTQFNEKFHAALLGFDNESAAYCQGISDPAAYDYAMTYARMLQDRARGINAANPRIPYGLFEPNRNLIRTILEAMADKHFSPAEGSRKTFPTA